MPSPFPGMDPYLEDAALWPDFHTNLITAIQHQLNRQLTPKYHARVEDRVFVYEDGLDRSVRVPDVAVVSGAFRRSVSAAPREYATGVVEPIEVTGLIDDEVHERSLRIIDSRDRRVVAVIEVLSPSNKWSGSPGRELYQQKRREVFSSESHWVEIDLLLRGVPFFPRELAPECEYLVHISRRAGERRRSAVIPIRLQRRLPSFSVPLRDEADDPSAVIDLQAALESAYEGGAYDYDIDYGLDPSAALTPALREWVVKLLLDKGMRSA